MTKITFIISALISFAIYADAQIPNAGFEDWDNYPNYADPVDFLTPNSFVSTGFYPITKSTDHFPTDVGSNSVRLENNIALLPNIDAFGIILQNNDASLSNGPGPFFPIVGHPTSLTGYFKYSPQNYDTMRILIVLFNNGFEVTGNSFTRSDTTTDWTSFTIPIPDYVTADSGTILIAAYNAGGHPPSYSPRGNSVLYIDNLNFDELVTSTNSNISQNSNFNLYPNPAFDFVTVNINDSKSSELKLSIFNMMGELVRAEKINSNQRSFYIGDLKNGVYMMEIKSNELLGKQKLLVQK